MRATVVGGGVFGLSAAWALTRNGHAVTLIDKSDVPDDRAASVDTHRFIRHAYGRARGYTRMVDDAYRALDTLWQDIGESFVTPTGTLIAADAPGAEELEGTIEVFREQGRALERIDGPTIAARWPVFTGKGIVEALHIATGGVFHPAPMLRRMAAWLRASGATVLANAAVDEIDPSGARVRLRSGEQVASDVVVVAAGAWTAGLLPDYAPCARPSRQVCAYAEAPADTLAAWAEAPIYLQVGRSIGLNIGQPLDGRPVKIGDHGFSLTGDPDEPREAGAEATASMLRAAADALAGFERYRPIRGRRCFYTVAPEERFVVERRGGAWGLTGFSGHGFKFAPLIGLRLARSIDADEGDVRLARWAAGHET